MRKVDERTNYILDTLSTEYIPEAFTHIYTICEMGPWSLHKKVQYDNTIRCHYNTDKYNNGLVQDCSDSSALAMELL